MFRSSLFAFVALAVPAWASPRTYSSVASLSGQSFLDAFQWEAISDPTHGRVNYVDAGTAWSKGMVWISGNTVGLKADDTTYLSASGVGRDSFRLQSTNTYSQHVAVFDIGHMPEGCGTWPAVFGANWPNEGEIDIIEGVNNQSPNQATLHTSAGRSILVISLHPASDIPQGCTQPSSRWEYGASTGNDCDVYTTGNSGCGVKFPDENSFGPNFNTDGGGWYAMERSALHIKVWFWTRDSVYTPNEVKNPGSTVTPEYWGEPSAYFYNTDCDFPSHFGPMNIVINLTFCGDWAGNAYGSSECPSDCVDYVNNNPSAFSNAYFEFNSLNIYE